MRVLLAFLFLGLPTLSHAAPPGLAPPGFTGEGGRVFAPSGRQLAFRVDAPTVRAPEDVRLAEPTAQSALVFVVAAVDGDTLRLRGGETVRLIGVDTPETKHPAKPVERCGAEASAFARAAVDKRWVRLAGDEPHPRAKTHAPARDKYGRWLAYAHRDPDGFFLNAEIVRQGAGRAYTRFPFRLRPWFTALEREAKAERLGIWAKESAGLCDLPPAVVARAEPPPPLRKRSPAPRAEALAPQATPPIPSVDSASSPVMSAPRAPRPDPAAERQPGCDIKGNVARDGERIYHVPGGQSYTRTQIDTAQGERWFCTEEEARSAGWRRAAR